MILRPCRAPSQIVVYGYRRRLLSTSRVLRDDPQNHYETLGIQPNATQGEIKKQFYTLSKSHHPDLHPNDASAGPRFMKISEAYHILGSSEKRAKYDRSIRPASAPSHPTGPRGSHSSHTSPAGGRPASGLSRRRTHFRGPPPSFYRSGGWGGQGAKRSEYASRPRTERDGGGEAEGAGAQQQQQQEPGMGPGGFATGFDEDVPHFDRAGHFRTQESVERMRHRARRGWVPAGAGAGAAGVEDIDIQAASGGALAGFLAILGVLGVVITISAFLGAPGASGKALEGIERKRKEGGGS